jgi:hypothetical protein
MATVQSTWCLVMWQYLMGWHSVSYIATHGIFLGEWKGATWPNHGLPRGTPDLAFGLLTKILWRLRGLTPGPPHHTRALTMSANHNSAHCFLFNIWFLINLNSHMISIGGGSGQG